MVITSFPFVFPLPLGPPQPGDRGRHGAHVHRQPRRARKFRQPLHRHPRPALPPNFDAALPDLLALRTVSIKHTAFGTTDYATHVFNSFASPGNLEDFECQFCGLTEMPSGLGSFGTKLFGLSLKGNKRIVSWSTEVRRGRGGAA